MKGGRHCSEDEWDRVGEIRRNNRIDLNRMSLGFFAACGAVSQIKIFDTDTSGQTAKVNSGFQRQGIFNFLIFIKFHFCIHSMKKARATTNGGCEW